MRQGQSDAAAATLLPENCGSSTSAAALTAENRSLSTEPNATTCWRRYAACVSTNTSGGAQQQAGFPASALTASVTRFGRWLYRQLPLLASRLSDAGARTRMLELMLEVYANGPAVSVLALDGAAEAARMQAWRGDGIFVPTAVGLTNTDTLYHCILVVGWGFNRTNQQPFWWVQNSYGPAWGVGGTGKIVRGQDALEARWRAVAATRRPCWLAATRETYVPGEACGVLPLGSNNATADGRTYGHYDDGVRPASATPPPLVDSTVVVIMPPTIATVGPSLSNGAVVGIALASAAVVAGLALVLVAVE